MKVPSIITVRTNSSRLPLKCLLPFGELKVIEHIIERCKYYDLRPILCTSTDSGDDILFNIATKFGIEVFRGSLDNKLKRWLDCAHHFNLDSFHTVDADDPFFDGDEVKRSFELLKNKGLDMVKPTNISASGSAIMGFSLTTDILERAYKFVDNDEQDTEMMWGFVDKVEGLKSEILSEPEAKPLLLRLTLDYEEDYWLLMTINRILGPMASRKDIDSLFTKNPDLTKINWFRNSEWAYKQTQKLESIKNQ